MSIKAHTRHMRGAIGTHQHFDWSANGDGLRELEPAELIQRDPISVIRSIDRSELIGFSIIFLALGFCAGALLAIGN